MTKYHKLEMPARQQEPQKTAFKKLLNWKLLVEDTSSRPEYYDHVMFLYSDVDYGDVFLAWNDGDEDSRRLYFGKKGNEFL